MIDGFDAPFAADAHGPSNLRNQDKNGDSAGFRANLLTGKGKKTERFVYSNYYDNDGVTPENGTSSCEIKTLVP